MDWSALNLPDRQWELSAAESQVLMSGPESPNTTVLKFGIFELLLKGHLRLFVARDRRFYFFRKNTNVLTLHRTPLGYIPGPLRAILECFVFERTFVDGSRGLTPNDVATRLLSQPVPSGTTRRSYVESNVLPSLVERGLFTMNVGMLVESHEIDRWRITDEGKYRHEELLKLLEVMRGPFTEWVHTDPALARAWVDRAGSSVLLLGGLSEAMRILIEQSKAMDMVQTAPELIPESERERRQTDRDPATESSAGGLLWYPLVFADWQSGSATDAFADIDDSVQSAWNDVSDAVDNAWDDITDSNDGE